MKKNVTLLLITMFGLALVAFGGTTGKIVGNVSDAKNGEALPGVNVIVVGTTYGAITDFEGNFTIINLSPGTYSLRVSAVGYAATTITNIKVNIDLTTTQDFKLSEEAVQLQNEVVIVAERPLVQKDLTSKTAVVGGDEIKQLPVTEISQVIGLQGGNVAGSIRGGRKGETSYWIDGVPVTDAFDRSTVVDVNPSMVQELQVLSGAFNAEYGQAMSGIVNIATREAAEKYSGSVTLYGGDFLTGHHDIFRGLKTFRPLNIRNIEASLSGPLVGKDVSLFLNARSIYFGGYLNGERRYNPNAVVVNTGNDAYVIGTDPGMDSAFTFFNLFKNNPTLQTAPFDTIKKYFDQQYGFLRSTNANGVGDHKSVPMNWNKKLYLQGKLALHFSSNLKLNLTGIVDNVDSYPTGDWGTYRTYIYNPDGRGLDHRRSFTTIMQFTHTLSYSTFYTLGGSYFTKSFKHYLYENENDPRYVNPYLLNVLQITPLSFGTGGTDMNRYYRSTTTGLVKLDINSQVSKEHYIKGGAELRLHRMFLEDMTLQPIQSQTGFTPGYSSPYITTRVLPDSTNQHDRYVHHPTEFSAYLQDKMEFKDLIINIGVRFDYFEPDANILADDEDPYIYAPYKESNKFFDYNGNGLQEANEPSKTVADRKKYWYKKASSKIQVSPRFGASFPITDRGVIHFSYGHFFQIPNFERLYQNPGFKIGSGTGNVDLNGNPMGNANLNPEQTINGEIGLQQQLSDDMSMDITAYLRDIRNLTGTRADQIFIGGANGPHAQYYSKFTNSDFGYVRGLILSLTKRFTQGLSLSVDYTFQIARGTASDPKDARNNAGAGGEAPEVQFSALGWDQRHTLNTVVSYSQETYGGSIIASYGSGTPYTPPNTRDVSVLLTNTEIKPTYYNADVRVYKSFVFDPIRLLLFLRVNNIFDIKNETDVYGDTGRAGKTYEEERNRLNKVNPIINSLHDYYNSPLQYSEPRRVEVGATIEF